MKRPTVKYLLVGSSLFALFAFLVACSNNGVIENPFTNSQALKENIKTLPTKASVSSIGISNKSAYKLSKNVSNSSSLSVGTIHGEMKDIYDYLLFDDMLQSVVANCFNEIEPFTQYTISSFDYADKTYTNCMIEYSIDGAVLKVLFAYDIDSNTRRKAFVTFSDKDDLSSGNVTVSYYDKVADESIYNNYPEDVCFVYYCNIQLSRSSDSFYYYRVMKEKRIPDPEFRYYSQYFALIHDGDTYNLYRTYCDIYENYNGYDWLEWEITTERTYGFIDTQHQYAGKTVDRRVYFLFDEMLELQYLFSKDGDGNIAAFFPVKYIVDSSSKIPVFYDDQGPWSVFIDQNDNKEYDNGEPIIETGMQPLTQVFTGTINLLEPTPVIEVFVYNTGSISAKDITINYYHYFPFDQFENSRQSYVSGIYDSVTAKLDEGITANYYKGNTNYNTEKPTELMSLEI
jgi:hypothetical protein